MKELKGKATYMGLFFLLICSALPVFDFFQENITEARVLPYRGIFYIAVNFIILISTWVIAKKALKQLSARRLAYSLGIGFTSIFYLFLVNYFIIETLGSSYQFRYFVIATALIVPAAFVFGYLLSKFESGRSFVFMSMLVFCGINIFDFFYSVPSGSYNLPSTHQTKSIKSGQENVYYIIPDMMIGPEGYQKIFGRELKLTSYLKNNGFELNQPAFSNAPVTLLSVSHVFNMDYFLKADKPISVNQIHAIGNIFKGNNNLFHAFHELGYTIRRVADGYVSYCTGYEDVCINKNSVLSNQDVTFIDRTQLITTLGYLQNVLHVFPGKQFKYPKALEIDEITQTLKIQPKSSTFTLLHLGLPHYPFRFRADCSRYQGDSYQEGASKEDAYHEQLQCSEQKYEVLIGRIIKEDPSAIILFQSDHGTILHEQGFKPNNQLSHNNLFENFNIISAYRMPESCEIKGMMPISPVNSFRVILGCLTDKQQTLLPNKSFLAYYLDWPAGHEPVTNVNPSFSWNKES
jgi:hypothetical protein